MHDADLVARAQGGDRSALEDLLRLHYDRIHAVCRRMLSNEADALDATQDTLLAVATRLHRYDGRSAFGTWVYRVAVNTCLDELRRRNRRATATDDEQLLARGAAKDDAPRLDQAVADSIDIDRALAMLPPDFRACVVLRDLCGLDYAEIGATLGLRPGTVRSRIARGRMALARLLGNRALTAGVELDDDDRT